ncbi:MAG: flagellar hook-length control protein FliK [Bryobacteraceae bacterium]
MAFPVKPPLVLDKATPAAAVAPIIAAQSEPQTNTGWKACATWVEAAITAQTGLDQANTGWKASATWATPSGTVQAVPDQSNTGGKACATQLAFAAILTDRTATITAQAKPDQTNTGWKACATAAVREVPPEPTKAPVITVAPVEIGSNKPQTPANPSPIHSEPPKGELKTEINSPIHPQPTRQISLKLTGTESGSVDVRISERAGKVQVDVRTPDGQLARTLRADLGDLVGRLDKRGFDAETSIPQNHLALTIRSPERPENNADPGSKQSQGQDSPHPQGERRGGRPRHGRGRGFAEVITERNEETHVNSN